MGCPRLWGGDDCWGVHGQLLPEAAEERCPRTRG